MSKKVAGFFLVLDLAFLGAVGYLTWQRYLELQQPAPEAVPVTPEPLPAPEPVVVSTDTATVALSTAAVAMDASSSTVVAVSTETAPATPVPEPTPVPAVSPGGAKIKTTRFTYYSRTAKQVQIVGDFNNWNPQNFRRNDKGGWAISLPVPPGDYSYNYLVDGKTVRDPNQPRTDTQGRSLLSLPGPAAPPSTNP